MVTPSDSRLGGSLAFPRWWPYVNLCLSVLSIPFFATAMVAAVVMVKRWGRMPFWTWVCFFIFSCTIVIPFLLYAASLPVAVVVLIYGVSVPAAFVRAFLRKMTEVKGALW